MGQKGSAELTMAEVARRAGVSIATVSRALRGQPGVGAATRERVRAIADNMAYVVSPEASGLSRRLTGRVALVMPRLDLWFYATLLAATERELRAAGIDVLVFQIDGAAERRRFFRELPTRRKVDAVILAAFPLPTDEAERLDLIGVHVVVAGGRLRDYPHVRVDDYAAARAGVRHLVDLGHRRIGMLGTSDLEGAWWSVDEERTAGYRDELRDAGVEPDPALLVRGRFGVGWGMEGMRRLLELDDPPSAAVAYSDEIAVGALRALQQGGWGVPDQVSVVGIDDHPLAEPFGLTTIRQHVAEQGRRSARMALDLIRGEEVQDVVLPTELVVRGSTGPAQT